MADVTLYGPVYSSYTRIVRMALSEKAVDYDLVEIDYVFAGAHRSPEHLARHPFGKLPVLEHDGFRVYEATAIARYVDEAFVGPALQPSNAKAGGTRSVTGWLGICASVSRGGVPDREEGI